MRKKILPLLLALFVLTALAVHAGARALRSQTVFSFAEEKQVYLTFDDGPSTLVTGRVLDVLRDEHVRATFFIVSERVRGREDVLRRIVREGHTPGVHSACHRYGDIYKNDDALRRDAAECAAVIERVTGVTPRVYRFPGGLGNARRDAVIGGEGYEIVRWNAVCGDEEIANASPARLLEETVRTSEGKRRVVLLLHDSAPHRATAEALPAIIGWFRAQGYLFCAF